MKRKKRFGEKLFDFTLLTVLILFCTAILLPFLNLIAVSMSDEYAIMRGEVTIFPKGFSLNAYRQVLSTDSIMRAYGNTILVAGVGCVASLFFTALAAYPLAFANFPGKKLYSILIMITLWFSGGMIPSFLVVSQLGIIDSLFTLVAVSLISAYNVLILKSFFNSIPVSMIEAAKIDGAGEFHTLFKIVLPLSKAALATIALWIVVGHWNDYMSPLIYLKSFEKYTLQLVLRDIVLSSTSSSLFDFSSDNITALPEQLRHAVIVVAMLPVLAVYPFVQKYFVKGVMLGAEKG